MCGKKPILYSFYEGAHPNLNHIKIWKDDRKITRDEYLIKALKRLKSTSPIIFKGMLEIIQKIQIVEAGFIDPRPLPEIPFLKPGCTYQEIASRQYDNKFLFVDMDLYPRLTPMGQAGVIFQEAFFAFTSSSNMIDPYFARQFVAKVFSDEDLNPKLVNDSMTPEQKEAATMKLCTNQLDALTKGTNIYVEAIKICKEKTEGSKEAYQNIKRFLQDTIDKCLNECFWEEGRKTCQRFVATLQMKNPCD